MSAIDHDAPTEDHGDNFDADAAFLKLWGVKDAETPSDPKASKADDEDKKPSDAEDENEGSDETNETEGKDGDDKSTEDADENEGGEEQEGDDNDATVVVKDEYKTKVKVGDKEEEVSIGSLKRLYGQEAALTQKSQQVSADRKKLDTQAATHVAALDRLLAAANKRFEPYKNLNLLAAAKDPNISAEELSALQQAQNSAYEDVHFLTKELGHFQQQLQTQRADELRTQAAETVKALSDPDKGIPGFSDKMYGEMVDYAQKQGVPAEALNEIVDQVSLRILHKAMLYDRGAAKVKKEADPQTSTNKSKAPKKIVKSITNRETTKETLKGGQSNKQKVAMKHLRDTGDATLAFEARFSTDQDD